MVKEIKEEECEEKLKVWKEIIIKKERYKWKRIEKLNENKK